MADRGRITVSLDGVENLGAQLKKRTQNFSDRQTRALQATARQTAEEIEDKGRQNIAAGGNFGSARWQQGFRALVSFRAREDINIRVTHAVPYWRVFELGATILGRPLLWIPLEGSQADVRKVRARDFGAPLFRVNRPGKAPLLLDFSGTPQYFGKESVRIPRKWRLRIIVRQAARRMAALYRQAMRNGRR